MQSRGSEQMRASAVPTSTEQLHAVRKDAMNEKMSFSLVDFVLGAQGVNKLVLLTHP